MQGLNELAKEKLKRVLWRYIVAAMTHYTTLNVYALTFSCFLFSASMQCIHNVTVWVSQIVA